MNAQQEDALEFFLTQHTGKNNDGGDLPLSEARCEPRLDVGSADNHAIDGRCTGAGDAERAAERSHRCSLAYMVWFGGGVAVRGQKL